MDEKEAKAAAAEIAREQELAREEELAARHAKWAKKGRKERFAAEDRTIEGKKQVPLVAILLFLGAVVIVLSIISLCVGRFHVDIQTTLRILLSPFTGETDGWTANEWTVITTIRIPRVIAACLVGAALALSGASYQGVFQNPLVSPDILGVSYGACVGAALAILLNLGGNTILVQLFAFVGGIITVFVTVSIPKLMHRHSNVVMVLSGVIVGGFMSSILGLMKYVADPDTQLQEITYWQLGSIAKVDFDLLLYTAPVMIVAGIILLAMRWRLNLISLGEEEARSQGVDLRKERLIIIVAATILTASAVSVAGTIGWVGLIIPHMARRLVGADNKRLIPTVILVAMAFMLLIDLFARNISGWEVPLGVLTGLIGAPLFGYILVRQREVD